MAPPKSSRSRRQPAAALEPALTLAKTPRAERYRFAAIGMAAGVVWFLSCADFDVWPFAWFAMVPTLYVTERARTHREAFFYAWLTGVVGNGGGFYWIVGLLVRFGHMPWILAAAIFALLAAYQGLVFAAFGVSVRAIRTHTRWPMAVLAPLAIVTFELILPMIFPFSVAITQAWQIHVIQIAELVGQPGVAALLLMVNGAIYDVLVERPRRPVPALASAGVLAAALVYGHVRIGQVDRDRASAPTLRIGVVQPNVSFDQKGRNRALWAARQLADLQAQSLVLQEAGADLIVWPETGYPYVVSRGRTADFGVTDPRRILNGFARPLLFGTVTRAPTASARHANDLWNTATLIRGDGTFGARFDKMFLMVFGEYTPGRDTIPLIDDLMPTTTGQFVHGKHVNVLPFTDDRGRTWRIGPMICYEDILPSLNRELGAYHPHLLVNLTNDSWFGETSEPWEHLALSVYRTVEMRVDLVRAVNTGVSAFVDAAGRVYTRSYAVNPMDHPRGADHILAQVAMREGGHTVFMAIGNAFAYLCALLTAYLLLVRSGIMAAWLRRRRGLA